MNKQSTAKEVRDYFIKLIRQDVSSAELEIFQEIIEEIDQRDQHIKYLEERIDSRSKKMFDMVRELDLLRKNILIVDKWKGH